MKISELKLDIDVIKNARQNGFTHTMHAALNACHGRKDIPAETIMEMLKDVDWYIRAIGFHASWGREDIPVAFIERGLRDSDSDVTAAACLACRGRHDIPAQVIDGWLGTGNLHYDLFAAHACIERNDISLSFVKKWANSRRIARVCAMNACRRRTYVPMELIEHGLIDDSGEVRRAAMLACHGRHDIPLSFIERGLDDDYESIRAAAMKACVGRPDIPMALVKRGLKDLSAPVRAAAVRVLNSRSDVSPYAEKRHFKIPKTVYKKCGGGVIVEASIPGDAIVRGGIGKKCRASKAVITKVNGETLGLNIGVSGYDHSTVYRPGDTIVIDNFDPSDEECSTGFHFFCTRKEVDAYHAIQPLAGFIREAYELDAGWP